MSAARTFPLADGATRPDAELGPRPERIARVAPKEIAIAWALLVVVGALSYGPHAIDGGFTLDDWANASGALQSGGFGGALSYFADLTMYRPVLVVYVPLTYEAFGMHMGFHLAWAAGLGIAVSCVLFAILRTVRLPRVHAGALATLVLVFPWFDSTRFWATASQVTLGVLFASGGVWLALIALRRRSWRLHVVSLLLYAASILTYEIALLLVGAVGILYIALVGWRAGWKRWAADVVLMIAGAAWVASQTTRESSGFSDNIEHLKIIVTEGGTLLGRTVLPAGPQRTTIVLVSMACLAAVAVAVAAHDRGSTARRGTSMMPWLLLGAAGLGIASVGWAIFIPADPYYTPSVYGVTNRVNGLAGIGLVMLAYAGCGLLGALLGRLTSRPAVVATTTTIALAAVLGVGYFRVLDRHTDIWTAAFRAQMAGLGQMKTQFPTLPDGSTLFVSGYPNYQTLGVPIYSTTWDVDGATKMQYRNPTLRALPVFPDTHLVCERDGVRLTGAGYDMPPVAYGQARFLEVNSGRNATPLTQRACRRVAPTYVPGPLYLSYDY